MNALPPAARIRPALRLTRTRTRTTRSLTPAGWLLAAAGALLLAWLGAPALYDWLACGGGEPDGPPPGSVIIEGWLSDDTLDPLAEHPALRNATHIYCTGGPFELGRILSEHTTFADLTQARLIALGIESNRVSAIPAGRTRRDRTWVSARTLREHLRAQDQPPAAPVWLISQGVHARRSRRLFRHALRGVTDVEVWALPPDRFDRTDWWKSSEGFKSVLGELVAGPYTLWMLLRTPSDAPLEIESPRSALAEEQE
jgi:uncharacterized SAM-binding protein YcdF (DUF218 family)